MNRLEYFWELEYPFSKLLTKLFGDSYHRTYGCEDTGIYNIVRIDGKLYDVTFKQAKVIPTADNKMTADSNKNEMLNAIAASLTKPYVLAGGKLYLHCAGGFKAKVEIVKKMREIR